MMPDREELLSRYIDYLNQERRPPQAVEEGPEGWQELLAAVRLAKSLKDPAMPEADFPRRMAGRLARLLETGSENTRRHPRPWWWLGGAVAVIAVTFLSWNLLAHFKDSPRVAMQAQEELAAGSQGELATTVREYDHALAPTPESETKALGGEAATAQGKGTAGTGAIAGGELAGQREAKKAAALEVKGPAEGGSLAGQSQGEKAVPGESSGEGASAPGQGQSGGAAAEATAANLSQSERLPAFAAGAPPQPQDSQAGEPERPRMSSRSLKAETILAPGLQVEISLDTAALQQPGRFSVRLANTTDHSLSLNFPTPILVIKEAGSGEDVWRAALALNLPLLLGAGKEVFVATTWPGPERPGWYTASVEGINATATGTGAKDSVSLQGQPLEFFVPYPPGKVRVAGELQLPVRLVRDEATVTVEKVSFTPDSTLVRLALQGTGLNAPLDFQVTAAWDGGQAEFPRQVVQEAGNGSVWVSAWFNPAPATATRLGLVLAVKVGPAGISGEPWALDIPLELEPAQSETLPEQPGGDSVPEEVYGEEGQPAAE